MERIEKGKGHTSFAKLNDNNYSFLCQFYINTVVDVNYFHEMTRNIITFKSYKSHQ